MYYSKLPCMAQAMINKNTPSIIEPNQYPYHRMSDFSLNEEGMAGSEMSQISLPTKEEIMQSEVPQTLQDIYFTPGYLKTQIGKKMRVEFLIGTNGPLVDRTGILLFVGASYIILKPDESDDRLLCDIYSIKFVTILL